MTASSRTRLLASLATSTALLYLATFPAVAALGAEISNIPNVQLDSIIGDDGDGGRRGRLDISYEPDFAALGGGSLDGRDSGDINVLGNNGPRRYTLQSGSIAYFAFSLDGIMTRDEPDISEDDAWQRDDSRQEDDTFRLQGNASGGGPVRRKEKSPSVFLSANICRYPERVSGKPLNSDPPQLKLLLSADASDEHPDSTKAAVHAEFFHEGAVLKRVGASMSTVYFSIESPDLSDEYEGAWSVEVAVSTSGWYHSFEEDENQNMLWAAEMDNASALLMTKNLTDDGAAAQAIMDSGPQYALFVDSVESPRLKGVRRSFCGLETYAQIASMKESVSSQVLMSMTTRGPGRLPKQQFWLAGLNSTTAYTGILVRTGRDSLAKRQNGDAGSGTIRVFPETQFQTTTGDNCRLITDLDFCNDVEYAVPANDDRFNTASLASKYDDYARTMYSHFEKVLQQIPCEAPVTSKYSLARSCDDCKVAYKNWLCTVAIPRCEDLSSDNRHAVVRNAQQAFPNGTSLDESEVRALRERHGPAALRSRNEWIDEEIAPGPYRELLPCDDVCYQLVQSCPAAMDFSCPLPNGDDGMFSKSYARRVGGERSCNLPSALIPVAGAGRLVAAKGAVLAALAVAASSLL